MLKSEYFIKAVKAGMCSKLDWLISILTVSQSDETPGYAWGIKSNDTGHYAYIPNPDGSWNEEPVKLEDAVIGQRIFSPKDIIYLMPSDLANVTQEIETTVGRIIANYILVCRPFGNKIPFINKSFSSSDIGNMIKEKLEDDPENPEDKKENLFYISEFLELAKGAFYLEGISQAVTWGLTEKIMLPPPGLQEYKKQLFEEYAGRLHEAAAIAEIDAKLLVFYKEYIKGDEGLNFLISKKSINIVAKKKFLMHGAEVGLDGNTVNVALVENSLYDGWNPKDFAVMNNSLRLGSYSRGAETMLGGVEVKWMLRASSNINVLNEDCGSKLGKKLTVGQSDLKDIAGFTVIIDNEQAFVEDKKEAEKYLGKALMVRSPMFCKAEKTDFCAVCIGKRLSSTPYALSSAVSAYGSEFLSLSLAAAHAKALELAEMNLETAFF